MVADVNSTVEILNLLPLSSLEDDWAKSVWESEFTELDTLEETVVDEIYSDNLLECLRQLRTVLDGWETTQDGREQGLWTVIVENDLSLKTIVAFLAFLLTTGGKRNASFEKKEIGIWAARVYVKLVAIPGSSAFKVFHPELFEKSTDLLKQFLALGPSGSSKRKRSLTPTNSQRQKKKTGRKNRNSDLSFEEDSVDVDDEADELTPRDVTSLRKLLHALLLDIVRFVETFSLRQSVVSANHTVQVLAQLTRQDVDQFDGNFDSSTPFERLCLPALAFKGLQSLCSQLHGHIGSIMNATCKHLLPSLLMLIGDKAVQTVNKQLQVTRDQAVGFISVLIKQCGERGLPSIRTLLQIMCTKVTDRAEYRTKVSTAIVTIARMLPAESYSKMVQWFYKLSKHNQMNNRGFAIEIVSAMLATPELQFTEAVPVALLPYTTHRSLLGILLDRCSDKAPTVRARAITCFAHCLASRDESIMGTVRDIVTPQVAPRGPAQPRLIKTPRARIPAPEDMGEGSTNVHGRISEATILQDTIAEGSTIATDKSGKAVDGQTPLNRVHLTPGFDASLPDNEGVFSMLRRRARDEKVHVRKAALQAIESAVRFQAPHYTEQNVEVLRNHCRDPGLSVRKQSMQSLTDLLMDMPHDKVIQSNWLCGVLPLVIDREQTLSDKCMQMLEEIILDNIVPHARSRQDCHQLAWSMLAIISQPHSVDQRKYLQKACHQWSRQGKIKPHLIKSLETHIGTDNNAGAWMLLAEIAPAAPKIQHTFLLNYWQTQANADCPNEIMERVLTVMKCVAKHVPAEDRLKLIEDLKGRLMRFDSPPELISVSVNTLAKLCDVQARETGDQSVQLDWCKELVHACDQYLSKVVLEETDGTDNDEDKIVCYMFTLGEVVQLSPATTPKRVFLLVQSMIATPCIASLTNSQSDIAIHSSQNTEPTDLHNSNEDHSTASQSSQTLQGSQGTGFTQTQPLSQFRGSKMSSRVRAFAFITLGKLCLQHEGLAKKVIAALARELEISTDPAIRNNVVIIMCDLCVRYTTTANHYISNIASCLKDPSPLVRKQTLTLITRLLQEDYLKWKGALFYRFISTLLDSCEEIKKFGEFCLLHMLLQRNPNMFFQHFMECVFHFNDYKEHTIYNKFQQSDKDRVLFSLNGEKNTKKRLELYRFMLDHMTDDHKFQLQGKLCQEILGAIVDDILPLNDATRDILKDTLAILSSKEIKLSSLKVRPQDEVAGDEQEMAAVVIATAKKTIITQVVKKNLIENIVPIVVSLKHLMEKQRSPLLRELLLYLRELMKDYKNEVQEILSTDRQLATEIEFDLRKFEEQQQELAQARQAVAEQQATPAQRQNSPVAMAKSPTVAPKSPVPPNSPVAASGPMSPMRITSPRAAMGQSPRTPKLKGQGVNRSPGNTNRPVTPVNKNLAIRETALSTVAILNSAKRTAERQGILRDVINSPARRDLTNKTVTIDEATVEGGLIAEDDLTPDQPLTSVTPGRAAHKNYRAISTPSVAIGNITFHMDGNMTFMPPSPIPETDAVRRIYDESKSPAAIMPLNESRNGHNVNCDIDEPDEQLLLMKSPLAPAPRSRVWNVTSPAPGKQTRTRGNEQVEDEGNPKLNDVDENAEDVGDGYIKRRSQSKTKRSLSERAKVVPIRRDTRKSQT